MMLEARGKIAPQFMHALPAKSLHESAERKLILLAAPILDPAQVCIRLAAVGDGHLRNQYGIVTKGREDNLINCIILSRSFLAEVSDAENTLEALRIPRIVRAQHGL